MWSQQKSCACSNHHSPAQVHRPHVKKTGTLPHSGSFLCVNKFVRHFRKEERGDREGSAIWFLISGSEKEAWKDGDDQLLLPVMPTNNRPSLMRLKPHFANKLNFLDSLIKWEGREEKLCFRKKKAYNLLVIKFDFHFLWSFMMNLKFELDPEFLFAYKAALISFASLQWSTGGS